MSKLFKESWRTMLVGTVIAVVSIASVAGAASLITGKDVKNGTLKSQDLANSTVKGKKLSSKVRHKLNTHAAAGATGATGQTGATGDTGATGESGVNATYQGPHWGVIERNTIGSPVADLRAGPFVTGPNGSPPSGDGSLGIEVGDANSKVEFGNEVDFAGTPIASLTDVAYDVFQTNEDTQSPGNANNLPNIAFEINPHVGGKTYTSMVFTPDATASGVTPNQWSHIDASASSVTPGGWYFTNGTVATDTGCGQSAGEHFCTLTEAQQALVTNNDGGGPAQISLSVGIGKGRDNAFQGAVDDLRINNQVFNFEPFGVVTQAP